MGEWMRWVRCGLLAALVALLADPAGATVYRCTDASGKVVYQAQACREGDQARAVDSGQATRPARPIRPDEPAIPSRSFRVQTLDGVLLDPDDAAPIAAPDGSQPTPRVGGAASTAGRLAIPSKPRIPVRFHLVSTDGRLLPWSNAGPRDGQRSAGAVAGGTMFRHGAASLALDGHGREAYTLAGNGGTLVWLPKGMDGPRQDLQPPARLPRLSWASGLAWSTKDGLLFIASTGGEGQLYRYDTRNHAWLDARSLKDRHLLSLAFDEASGTLVGLSRGLELVTFSAEGHVKQARSLKGILVGLGSGKSEMAASDGLSLAAQGGAVAIISVQAASVTHIWTYELASGQAQLTYSASY